MNKAKILSLSDGSMTLLPRGLPAGSSSPIELALADKILGMAAGELGKASFGNLRNFKIKQAPAAPVYSEADYVRDHPEKRTGVVPSPSVPVVTNGSASYSINGHQFETRQLSEGYIRALGDSAERLASLTLARKLRSPAPITPDEAAMMVGLSKMPPTRGGRMLTEQILAASADELGKGGVVGSIAKTATSIAKKVIVPATRVMAAAAPILNKIPVIGPALGAAAQAQYNFANAAANGNLRSLTAGGLTGTLQRIAGGAGEAIGAAAAIAGAGAQGVIEAPGTIAADIGAAGKWLGSEARDLMGNVSSYLGGGTGSGAFFSSLLQGGRKLLSSFDSSVIASIESINPSLHGELTSIFHGLGSEYTQFQQVFDTWSAKVKAGPTGIATVGKLNGNLYSIIKDLTGHVSVTKTPLQNAPISSASLPDGSLIDASQLAGLGVPSRTMGAGYGPSFMGSTGAGADISPAGASLPGGPINPADDNTSLALLNQAARNANAGKSPADFQMAGFPMWAVAGLGVVALAALFKGGPAGPMVPMGQGWHMPARRYARNPRRKRR